MAPRAKKANRLKRVDSVRASKDGHQFHEAWVARRALGLLLPRFDLYGIAVEGLSEEDEESAPGRAVVTAPLMDMWLPSLEPGEDNDLRVLAVAEWGTPADARAATSDIRDRKSQLRQR